MSTFLWWYLAVGVVVLFAAWYLKVDADPGGYPDSIRTRDKVEHAAIALVLAFAATVFSGHPVSAFVITLALGIGWEAMQRFPRSGPRGFFSWLDVAADAAGALAGTLAALLIRWVF